MKQKNIILLFLVSIIVCLIVSCGKTGKSSETNKTETEKIKVALITSVGGLGDRSFNDAAWHGFQRAEKELGVEIKVIEPQAVADYQTSLKAVAGSGYKFVMAVGNDWADTMKIVAPIYPDIKFAGVNIMLNEPNVAVARFSDHEGSFMAGAIAAMMSKTGTIGFIGGMDVPAINRFYVGYEEGAKYANPSIKVISAYVGSFNDPGKGKEFSLQLIAQKADIIFHAAGKTGEGLFNAVKETDGIYAIGVDQNQDYIVSGKILTSMEKRIQIAAYNLIDSVINNNFRAGDRIYGLKEDGVGLTEMEYTKALVPPDVTARLNDIRAKIISGEIKVTDVFNK
ncbi:BMP family ABC transporter substrate-binding protein [Spirochaetia bacterium]|nr:BMP family ABC transporter substrate-binding protein [Spirochaetia bacterium]